MISIPQDIIHLIINQLSSDDTESLSRCALVSPIFLAESQRRLFSTIQLNQDVHCQNLLSVLMRNPHIAAHIRHLTISDKCSLGRGQGAYLALVLERMTLLQSLSLNYVSWHHLCTETRSTVLDILRLPSLVSLSFCGLYDFPLDHLAVLSQLKSLSLWFTDTPSTRDVPIHTINSVECHEKGQLETLSLGTHSYLSGRLVLGILSKPKSLLGISKLRKLLIETFSTNVIDLAGEVMRIASPSLEAIEWRLRDWVWTGKFNPGPIDLELTPNLRSISFEAACMIDQDEDPLPWLLSSLKVYSGARNLQVFSITLGDCTGGSSSDVVKRLVQLWRLFDYQLWPKFDSLLSGLQFCSLRKVNIVLMVEPEDLLRFEYFDVSKAIAWRMPRLHSAGILQVEQKVPLNRYHKG